MGLLAAIAGLATPILARVLLALGFSVVTFTGASAVVGMLKSEILSVLGGANLPALQLAGLGGAWVALGWVFGAATFTVTYWALTKAVRVVSG